ncbi:Rhodanese-related sulfurtransferase [Lutibacter agarilyticus]|uniref:Rhodanese-related sulfurtransferase n=1 Tax=Lutibacter agarilyticus TaxID=1109740 RepID=A0A238YNM9_9FLAO|nr:rhodanese-like domain-containing protein [Lutibacter agarilyticus]SNR72747.1 Rhodanese-related sulfurtransferase [Lutibacter agarilyticus]
MKKVTLYLVLFFGVTIILSSFKNIEKPTNNPPSEFELLVQYLESNGNFINTLAPALITAEEVKENLKNEKYLVLDIRSGDWFDYGHIKKSKNVKGPELLDYFENKIDPTAYDKITIICYSGQSASYYTSLLRLYGFNNVYSLKWGMSSWAEEFATNIWIKNSKDEYIDQVEKTANSKLEAVSTPMLNTGKTDAKEILQTRIKEAFAKPYKEFIVKSAVAFENPADYFIVNYTSEESYNEGHLKGAVQYQPKQCLASSTSLYKIPANKKILVNCDTGLSAAYAVAYLNVIGYDVYNLAYGSNSYMNSTLVEKGLNGWTKNEIKNFPIVE